MTANNPDLRFREIATRKLDAVLDLYDGLPVEAEVSKDDRALGLRHATGKTLLTHIALLRKLLGHDRAIAGETVGDEIDADGLQAMIAAARTPLDERPE
ncbi:hypothetical protein [Ferrovibrio terrae]|uniref:hypothetical protein n=1 Tax=Ferrovibrio terrae TaxID=2594003 RepID=UPI003137BA5E